MGYRETWIAVRSLDRDHILHALELRPVDQPMSNFGGPALFELESGWKIVSFDSADLRLNEARSLGEQAETITVTLSDTVMFSTCVAFKDGEQAWSVTHDAEMGSRSLQVEGEPPLPFAEIRDRLLAEQDRADSEGGLPVDHVYDIPIELARTITGFRHDDRSIDGARIPLGDTVAAAAAREKNIAEQLVEWFRSEEWQEHRAGIYYSFSQRIDHEWSLAATVAAKPIDQPRSNVLFTPGVGIAHAGVDQAVSQIRSAGAAATPALLIPIGDVLGLPSYKIRDSGAQGQNDETTVSEFGEAQEHLLAAFERLRPWCEPEAFCRAFSLVPGHRHNRLIADAYFGWDSYSDAFLEQHGARLGDEFNRRLGEFREASAREPSYRRTVDPVVSKSDLVTPWVPPPTPTRPAATSEASKPGLFGRIFRRS